MTNTAEKFFIDNLWRWKCGMPEKELNSKMERMDFNKMFETQWSKEFEQRRKNRMVMGTFRYGDFRSGKHSSKNIVNSIVSRSNQYLESGNMEHLLDIANLAMIEYVVGTHPKRHFESIDDGEHVK